MIMANGDPILITVAPNGARLGKAEHPAVPLTAEEIAADAVRCAEAGAGMIHLHVRDKAGAHLLDASAYRAATDAIRHEAGGDIIVQITSEAAGRYGPAEQMAAVRDTLPEAVSVSIRELAGGTADEGAFGEFLAWARRERVWPQFILYDRTDIERFVDLRNRGLIPFERPFVLLVLGRRDAAAGPMQLLDRLTALPDDVVWAACAFGPREAACTLTAAALGGHSRIGFENNTLFPDGSAAPDNAALIRRMREGAALLARPAASGEEAREFWALPSFV